jgi:hypothetical protein
LVHNPTFLQTRQKELEIVLDKILTAASTRSVAITNFTAVTAFLELNEKHTDRILLS